MSVLLTEGYASSLDRFKCGHASSLDSGCDISFDCHVGTRDSTSTFNLNPNSRQLARCGEFRYDK